jgi:RluA family pseudouridine synthase
LPNAVKSLIYKFNRKDKIKVKFEWSDGKFRKRDNEYKLQIWDEVKVFLIDSEFEALNKKAPLEQFVNSNWEKETLNKDDIVFEDSDLFILNKNPGINVHPGDHKTKESNIIAQAQDYLWDKLNSLTFKPSLIHRIDRDTSGILMIAKKKDMLVRLVNDFKSHEKVKKTYFALVLWKLSRPSGTITKKLLRIENAKNQDKVQVSEKGQTAITHYKKIAEHCVKIPEWDIYITEVEVQIETGRMHQIRVHMAAIWNPLLWDKAYWDRKLNAYFTKHFGLTRQALHAWKIEFYHYSRNKKIELTARIKDDLLKFIKKIKNK